MKILAVSLAAVSLGFCALSQNIYNPPIEGECLTNWCEVVQGPTGSITFPRAVVWPESPMCLGGYVYAWPETVVTCSDVTVVSRWAPETTNCPPSYSTWNACPYFITNWWVVNHPGFSGSGEGSFVVFAPTNCGIGSITFGAIWHNSDPCTGEPIGGGSISVTTNINIVHLEAVPGWTNALINRCQDPNRSVTFCLTNSCFPGGVTWTLEPILQDGATLTAAGGCATVKIGNKEASYTIIATSNDNTNCWTTASLQVGRDCDCTNHVISVNSSDAPGLSVNSPGCSPTDRFTYGATNTPCSSLSLLCSGSVYYSADGTTVGHCPYLSSQWWARYWPCQCGDVIMKTEFRVEHAAPFVLGPGPGKGKIETWTCSGGFQRWCYQTVNSQKVDREGGCNSGDE